MTLSALIRKRETRRPATAIPATAATEEGRKVGTVAGVATVAVATATNAKPEPASLALESINENCAEFYEERAAIMEYDGGLSREDAEAAARDATEKYRRECYERLQKAADAILGMPTRAMQKRELAKYCEGKSAAACAEMRGWLDHKSRGD